METSYHAPPAVHHSTVSRGNWLARVSHRASHIPANKAALTIATSSSQPASSARASSAGPSPAVGPGKSAVGKLPLRPIASQDFANSLEEQLSAVQRKTSLDKEPYSPALTDIQSTPIEASFGDRGEHRSSAPDRALPERPHVSNKQDRSRSGTVTREEKSLPGAPVRAGETKSEATMERYARQSGDNTYDSDAEADDEFERSVFTSPTLGTHYNDQSDHPSDSEDDHSVLDGEDTPTTQGWADRDGRSPTGKIAQWTEEEVADYVAGLSPALKQYGQRFVEEGVNGEALIALHHEDLKELGVASVGHRLTILKAIYEQKLRAGVRIDEGDYVPLSAEEAKAEMNATQDDVARIIESIKLRDQRIIAAEQELRAMRDNLDRISEENKKLREETLPIMRLVKDQRTPLPDPSGGTLPSPREAEAPNRTVDNLINHSKGSSLSRKFSTKKLFLKSDNTKQPSPTHPPQAHTSQPREVRDDGGTHLEASAAAIAASSHLTASMTAQTSPNSVHGSQLSPTSPAYSTHQPPGSAAARSFPQHAQRGHGHDNDAAYTHNHYNQSEREPPSARLQQDRSRRQAPTPSPREDETPGTARDKDNPQVEIFKSFRVSIDDPCRVVLPVALKRYNITDDWRQYALYIVHGDQERCLGLEEKPLLLFKQLDKEGRKPMFMLRRHASPQEGWSNTSGSGAPAPPQEPKPVPGGVL